MLFHEGSVLKKMSVMVSLLFRIMAEIITQASFESSLLGGRIALNPLLSTNDGKKTIALKRLFVIMTNYLTPSG